MLDRFDAHWRTRCRWRGHRGWSLSLFFYRCCALARFDMNSLGWELGGLFASAFISSTLAPGGSEAVLAVMIGQGNVQSGLLVSIATVGNTLGAMTTWGLGRLAAIKFSPESTLSDRQRRALVVVRRRGVWALLFSWLPVVGDAFCFAAGWLKLPVWSGVLAILFGKLGRYAAIAWLMA